MAANRALPKTFFNLIVAGCDLEMPICDVFHERPLMAQSGPSTSAKC